MSDWDDAQQEINSGGGGFYDPKKIGAVGASEEIVILSYCKWTQTKFPIKDKEGKSKGYTWRFRLADGRVWDVGNRNRSILMAGIHPHAGKDQVEAGRFRVTYMGDRGTKAPNCDIAYLGRVHDQARTPEPSDP